MRRERNDTNALHFRSKGRYIPRKGTNAWYMMVGNAYLEGPYHIYVSREIGDKESLFVPILKMQIITVRDASSWSIYHEAETSEGEQAPDCVLYHVSWNRTSDMSDRSGKNSPAPMVSTRCVSRAYCSNLLRRCERIDSLLYTSFSSPSRSVPQDVVGHYISVSRHTRDLYIEVAWDPSTVGYPKLEAELLNLGRAIEEVIQKHRLQEDKKIESMVLRFDSLPQEVIELLETS